MVFKKSYQWIFYRFLEGIFLVFLGLPRLLPPDIFRRGTMPLLSFLISFLQVAQPDHVRKTVTVQGIEHLDAALAKGNGVIALGAHIGNFVLVGARLGVEGYPFHTLFRIPSDPRIGTIICNYLPPRLHQRVIPSRPRRAAVRQILSALKRNEIVFILGDNLKKGKVQTLFFGQRVFSPRGPVSLALRSGAAVG